MSQISADIQSGSTGIYHSFLDSIAAKFTADIGFTDPLFIVNAPDIWNVYLSGIPEEFRQENQCRTCKHFFERFGAIVLINADGSLHSPIWSAESAPDDLRGGIEAVKKYVESCDIESPFVSSVGTLGKKEVGGYSHYSLQLPPSRINRNKLLNDFQLMAQKKEYNSTLRRALGEFKLETLQEALRVLESDSVNRSEKFVDHMKWLIYRKNELSGKNRKVSDALIWKAVGTAPHGWCTPKSEMVGTLLEDIASGHDFDSVQSRWNAKMHPLQYQRPQALPTSGAVKAAEEMFEKLNLKDSLLRRFARLGEVPCIWNPSSVKSESPKEGIFADIPTKNSTKVEKNTLNIPAKTISWAKFTRTVLGTASKIELKVPSRGAFTALVTAENMDSPPIIRWDLEGKRNPLSQYVYNNGSYASDWNLASSTFVTVSGISREAERISIEGDDKRIAFILSGAKDTHYASGGIGAGAALFPEVIRADLHGVRSVIEAYSKSHGISGYADASACGIWVSDGNPVTVRVTDSNGTCLAYTIERME